jgi:hypothetical protein
VTVPPGGGVCGGVPPRPGAPASGDTSARPKSREQPDRIKRPIKVVERSRFIISPRKSKKNTSVPRGEAATTLPRQKALKPTFMNDYRALAQQKEPPDVPE